jgi:hypothetical protein
MPVDWSACDAGRRGVNGNNTASRKFVVRLAVSFPPTPGRTAANRPAHCDLCAEGLRAFVANVVFVIFVVSVYRITLNVTRARVGALVDRSVSATSDSVLPAGRRTGSRITSASGHSA